jgi:LuxR family maltose regulon positive regulatory protein
VSAYLQGNPQTTAYIDMGYWHAGVAAVLRQENVAPGKLLMAGFDMVPAGGFLVIFADGQPASGPVGSRAAADPRAPRLIEQLTSRELEVLAMLAAGRSNQGIASHLVISLDTVKKHVSHLMGKLGAANRTEAVARARELSLIP